MKQGIAHWVIFFFRDDNHEQLPPLENQYSYIVRTVYVLFFLVFLSFQIISLFIVLKLSDAPEIHFYISLNCMF